MKFNGLDIMRQDWNRPLNRIRANLNKEIREHCMEIIEQKKNSGVEQNGSQQ